MNRLIYTLRAVRLLAKPMVRQMSFERKSIVFLPFSRQILRNYSEQATVESTKDKVKIRRMYALGGCLFFMWISTHGILLYKRRSEHRELDQKLPPISFDEFAAQYITSGKVKSIVYQPQFGTANVYLFSEAEQTMKKTVEKFFHITPPDKFSRPPDVRFYFDGDQKEVETAIYNAQKVVSKAGGTINEIEFSVDQFPSYRELAFIIGSTLFTMAAITLMK